jgi:hypothetical protein
MPEMAEQRAISFAQENAIPLSCYVVGLCQWYCDHAKVVAGHDLQSWTGLCRIGSQTRKAHTYIETACNGIMKTALSSSGDVSVQGKGMTQFLVVGDGEEWTVKTETQALGCYTDRVRAIAAAIDLAEAEAKRETAHRW